MKKTQFIEIEKNIRKTLFSYISVILFVMLGVALFCGLGWSGKAFANSLDKYFDEYEFRDIEVIFPYGATENDIETIKEVEGVDKVEGMRETFAFFELNSARFHAKISMITELTDKMSYVEGSLPKNNQEIAVVKTWGKNNGIKLGDKITFNHDDVNGMKYLTNDEFTVTAFVESSTYISIYPVTFGVAIDTSTPLDCVLFVSKDAFDSVKLGGYGSVLVTSNSLKVLDGSSTEYISASDLLKDKILQAVKTSPNVVATIRISNGGYSAAKTTFGMYDKLRYSMAALFVVIGILVSYTSVSRIVLEQKVLIGTKKALGLRNNEIRAGYVIYALSAVLIGAILGVLMARFVVEAVFLSVTSKNFTISKCIYYFSFKETAIAFIVEASLILIAALLACNSVLRTEPIKLLNGADDKVFKPKFYEKTLVWNKMSLVTKSIINNFFKDKRRVVATIIGILGCASLVVCGLTFNSGLNGAFDKQFEKIQSFDTLVYYDQSIENSAENISSELEKNGLTYCKVYNSTGETQYKDAAGITKFFVIDEDMNGLFKIYDTDGNLQELGDKIWISCAFSEYNGIGVGDKITFLGADGRSWDLVIGGVYEYYLLRCQILMSKKAFSESFGYQVVNNAFWVDRNDFNASDIDSKLRDINGYIQTENFLETAEETYAPIESMGVAISLLYMALSIVLALLVLLNLFIMFIEEKKRELIIMLINGFPLNTVKKYIYSDAIFLSIIGVFLGVVLGTLMGNFSLKALSSEVCHFLYGIHPIAVLIGVVVTGVVISTMCILALKRIDKFKLTDINK